MGAYICAICDNMFCHHSVGCYEYGEEGTELICEDCYLNLIDEGKLIECGICKDFFNPASLKEVFKHEHKGISINKEHFGKKVK